jgi:hypothetical protein
MAIVMMVTDIDVHNEYADSSKWMPLDGALN